VLADSTQILVVEDDAKHGAMCARLSNAAAIVQKPPRPPGKRFHCLPRIATSISSWPIFRCRRWTASSFSAQSKGKYPHIEFIVMTGYGTVKTAVEAMQLGAAHYIQKAARPR